METGFHNLFVEGTFVFCSAQVLPGRRCFQLFNCFQSDKIQFIWF